MLPTASFAAFVAFHHEFNTFAFTKSLKSFTGGYNDDGRISKNLDNFLGYFTVRSCDDPTVFIVIQLNGRIPFSHVLINATQAQLAGLSEDQEVILEHVAHTVCKSVEIIPLTPHDFHVLDSHSSIVEEELLQQISIVRKGALFPFWLSPSVSAIFRIGSISPETDLPVILHNSSELHIAPVSLSSLSSPSIGPRPLSVVSMEKIDQLLGGVSHELNLFRDEKPLDLVSRCLPHEIVENDKVLSDILENHPSLVLTLYPGSYTICDAVRLTTTADTKKAVFSIVIRIPQAGSNLEGLFLSAQNILKDKKGSSLCSHPWSMDYVRFHATGLSPKKFQELSSIIVEAKDIEMSHFPGQKIRSHLLAQAGLFPILLGQEGIFYSFHVDGDAFTVHLRPGQTDLSKCPDSKETCFAVVPTTKIDFHELEAEPDSAEESPVQNFGFASTSLFPLEYQADILEAAEKLIDFHFTHSNISTNILVLGAAGSGRTCLLKRLSRSLANSWRCVFSLYIDCNTWKGKQAENIEKALKAEMRKLETRKPSALFLDNLDFFQLQNEEEQRQIGIEKIFHMIRSFLIQSEVPVVVTARKRTTLHKSLTTAGGIRLFSQAFQILPLTQVELLPISVVVQ